MFTKTLIPTLLAAFAVVRAQDAATDATTLASADLVGADGEVFDVADYAPTVGVQLTFDDSGFEIDVLPGVTLDAHQARREPSVVLASDTDIAGKGFLIAMVDPDAPTPQNRSVSQVRHWLGQNYVAGAGADGLYTLTPGANPAGAYAAPGPGAASDPHRYTVLIFEQPTAAIEAPVGDDVAPFLKFNIEAYAARIPGLKLVGGTFFRCGAVGTETNNGTYVVPGGSSPSASASVTGTSTRTTTGAGSPSGTPPPDAARALGVAGVLVSGVAAAVAALMF